MAVSAGELRHRVIIQQYISAGRDADGFDLSFGWAQYVKVWAKVTPLSTKDLLSAQAAQSEVTARMKLRYRTGTDIDTTMRVIWKGRIFAIDSQGLDDNDTGMEYTTFNLSGGVEQFKDGDPNINDIFGLGNTELALNLIEKLVNEDLPETKGR